MANDMAKRLMARVKALREAKNLTQEQFAERADLQYKHYQAIEAGRKPKLQLPTLVKLAKGCGLELWELLNFGVEPTLAEGEPEAPSRPKPSRRPRKR